MSNIVYYLETTAENCVIEATINGFPFYELNAQYKTFFGSPMNIGLIKGTNKLMINVRPAIENHLNPADIKLEVVVKLKEYESGGITAPELGKVLQEQTITSYGSYPMSLMNQTTVDFTTLFNSMEKVEDVEELKLFTELLVEKVKEKDFNFLMEAFSFKLQRYGIAYYIDGETYQGYGFDFLENYILKYPPKDYVPTYEMILYRSYNDKKIWYCYLSNGEDLIYSGEDEDEEEHFIPVYISKMNGEFRIVF